MTDNRDRQFDDAENAARVLVEANAATWGDMVSEGEATPYDNTVVMLRINGPKRVEQCGHLTGPTVVYLHSAIGVHQCGECASSEETRERIERHRPTVCDSCGDRADVYWPAQFKVTNIIVTAYICDDCRHGRREAALPDWVAKGGGA